MPSGRSPRIPPRHASSDSGAVYVWVIVCEMHCIRTQGTHTFLHMQQPVPGRTPQQLHDSLGERRDTLLASVGPSLRPTCEPSPLFPLTSTPAPRRPRTTSRFPPCPPASSPTKRHAKAEPMAVYTWEGGWAVHGRGGEQSHTGREGQKKRGPHLGRRKRLLVTPIDRTLCLAQQHRDETGREPRPKTNSKTIDSRCSIQA